MLSHRLRFRPVLFPPILAAVALAGLGCNGANEITAPQAAGSHSISGTVTLMDGDTPDVTVTANDASHRGYVFTRADSSGRYELSGLPPGTYTLAAVRSCYRRETRQVTVPPDATGIDFQLSEPSDPVCDEEFP